MGRKTLVYRLPSTAAHCARGNRKVKKLCIELCIRYCLVRFGDSTKIRSIMTLVLVLPADRFRQTSWARHIGSVRGPRTSCANPKWRWCSWHLCASSHHVFSFAETFQLLPDSHIVLTKRWRNSHTCKTKFFFTFSIMKKTSEEKKNKVFHLQSLMFDVCRKRNALGKCPNLKRKYLLLRALNRSAFDKKANIKSGQLSALLKRLFKRIGGKKVMKMLFCYEPSIQAKSRRLSSIEGRKDRKKAACLGGLLRERQLWSISSIYLHISQHSTISFTFREHSWTNGPSHVSCLAISFSSPSTKWMSHGNGLTKALQEDITTSVGDLCNAAELIDFRFFLFFLGKFIILS